MAKIQDTKKIADYRDQCALVAMQALISRNDPTQSTPQAVAELAFCYARAMVAHSGHTQPAGEK